MWSLKPHSVFAQNRMRSDFELPGSCHAAGPLSMWTSSVQIYKGLVEPKGPVEVAVVEVNSSNQKVDEESCIQVKSMKFDVMPLEVSLRDDPSIRGICQEFAGTEAQNFIKKEVPFQFSMKFWAWYKEGQRTWELVNNAKWSACGPLTWNFCLWGVLLVICLIVPLEATPYLLCFESERAASVAARAKFMAKLNGAKRVIGDELDDGEFWWQDCFFPVFVPWHSFASLWWQWCMPSKASHGLPLCYGSLLGLTFFIASRRSKKIGNAYNAVFSRSILETWGVASLLVHASVRRTKALGMQMVDALDFWIQCVHHRHPNLMKEVYFFHEMKGKLKALPRLQLSICEENSPRSSKEQSPQG